METVENDNFKDNQIFKILRPACVQVMKEPSPVSLEQLKAALTTVDSIPPEMTEYILFPIKVILLRKSRLLKESAALESLLSVLQELLKRSTIAFIETFEQLFDFFCSVLDQKASQDVLLHEHLIEVILTSLCHLLWRSNDELCQSLYDPKGVPRLGHCLFSVMSVLNKPQSRNVKLLCLNILMGLTLFRMSVVDIIPKDLPKITDQNHSDVGLPEKLKNHKIQSCLLSNLSTDTFLSTMCSILLSNRHFGVGSHCRALAIFFPGIVTCLVKVLSGNLRTESLVTSAVLAVLSRFILLVLPRQWDPDNGKPLQCDLKSNESNFDDHWKSVETKEWLESTMKNIAALLPKVLSQMLHLHWSVRLCLAVFSYSVTLHSCLSVDTCKLPCCESLIVLTQDERREIGHVSELAVHSLATKFAEAGFKHQTDFTTWVIRNLHNLCKGFKAYLHESDTEKEAGLRLLGGYLSTLGPSSSAITNSPVHLSKLLLVILDILKLTTIGYDVSGVSGDHDKETSTFVAEKLQFANFHSQKVEKAACRVCRLLGQYCPLFPITDLLFDVLKSVEGYKNETILVMKHILLGSRDAVPQVGRYTEQQRLQELTQVATHILDMFFGPASPSTTSRTVQGGQYLRTSADPRSSKLSCFQSSTIHAVLMLDVVNCLVLALGLQFQPLLQSALYPLLQKLGDPDPAVSNMAAAVLHSIATTLKYGTVEELLKQNVDYIVNLLSVQVKYTSEYPESVVVLGTLLKRGGKEMLTFTTGCLSRVLTALDTCQQDQLERIWAVLLVASEVIAEDCANNQSSYYPKKEPTPKFKADTLEMELADYFNSTVKSLAREGMADTDLQQTDRLDSPPYADDSKTLPTSLQVATSILPKIKHFITIDSPKVVALVLRTCDHLVYALQNELSILLPEVHKLWPALLSIIDHQNPVLVGKAVALLRTITDCSKDFLHQRLSSSVWGKLTALLRSSSSSSCRAGKAYSHTQKCKLQMSLLKNLHQICIQLKMNEKNTELLIEACIPYLHKDQLELLRMEATTSLKTLFSTYPDLVWLYLIQVSDVRAPKPLHTSLKEMTVPVAKDYLMFSDSVSDILKPFYGCYLPV